MEQYTSNNTLPQQLSIEERALLEEYPKDNWPFWANWLTHDGYVTFWLHEPELVGYLYFGEGLRKQLGASKLAGFNCLKIAR